MSLNEIVKTMQDAVNRQTDQAKPGGYDTTATVRRIEGDTAFVHIPGGVDETPVKLTINAKAGDNVQVRVSGGNAFLVGNGSAPPTDDARANQAYTVATVAEGAAENALANAARAAEAADSAQASATRAEGAANDAVIAAGDAQTAAGNAQTAADTALVNLATTEDVVGVLNWITAHGTMTTQSGGVFVPGQVYFVLDDATPGDYHVGNHYYSVVPEPKAADIDSYYILTVDESVQNYVATHIVVDAEGLWIIPDAGGNKVLIATGSGSTYTTAGTYIVGKVGGVDTVLAEFTASGAVIGENASGKSRTIISADGMQVYRNVSGTDTQIANLGYGSGTASGGGTADAPYYTFGTRPSNATIGNYSIVEGNYNAAVGYSSHAEGGSNVASGEASHAEGEDNTASGAISHAEGQYTTASGLFSHSQNWHTIAQRKSQTVIGEYNSLDTTGTTTTRGDYAVIVGNGTADNARSNALTVDWSGNVEAAGDVTDGAGNTLSSLITTQTYDLGAVSYTAGTIGTVGTTKTTSITKSGYTPIAVSVEFVSTSVVSFIPFFNTAKDTVYTHYVRRQSTAYSTTYHAYLYVTYLKN